MSSVISVERKRRCIMSTQSQSASESELIAYLEKLAQFHDTLSPREKEIMNEMTIAALNTQDVSGFGSVPTMQNLFVSSQGPAAAGQLARPYYYYRAVAGAMNTKLA
jgi:hypothetical protein